MEDRIKTLADFIKEHGNIIVAAREYLEYKKTLNK